jgi:hypothetical protein
VIAFVSSRKQCLVISNKERLHYDGRCQHLNPVLTDQRSNQCIALSFVMQRNRHAAAIASHRGSLKQLMIIVIILFVSYKTQTGLF